jgi:transposase, IS5 family
VSLFDPDARPIRKGKLGKPNEFGYVTQLAEVTENSRRGARGVILPASTQVGNPAENTLLPGTVLELERLGIRPREIALDGGFMTGPSNHALEQLDPDRIFIAGRQQPASKRTSRRLRRYRTGAEGRISHLKRRYGLDRSRLKGHEGQQIWTEWRSWPTTPTRSPSGPAETLNGARPQRPHHFQERPRPLHSGVAVRGSAPQRVNPRQVARVRPGR